MTIDNEFYRSKEAKIISDFWDSKTVFALKTFIVFVIVSIVLLNKESFTVRNKFNFFTGVFDVLIDLVIFFVCIGGVIALIIKLFPSIDSPIKKQNNFNNGKLKYQDKVLEYERYHIDTCLNHIFIYSIIFSSIAYNKHNFFSDGDWTVFEGVANTIGGVAISFVLAIILIFIKWAIPYFLFEASKEKLAEEEKEKERKIQLAKKQKKERLQQQISEEKRLKSIEQARKKEKKKEDDIRNRKKETLESINKKIDDL